MESFYGPSIPHSTSSILLEAVKDEKGPEDQAISESNDNIEQVLHKNVDEVINMILEEVLKEEDTNHVFSEEDPIVVSNEASKTAQEVVWPLNDPNPVVIRAIDFHSLNEGQWLTDTLVDFYFKYQERKYEWLKGFHFFNSFFFRKLVLVHQEDGIHRFEKIGRWIKGINIFNCDYIFLPILLR